jgi:hypothetical protein
MGKVIAMTRCPFHGDTDPSLAIYDNGYYCFGCHKSGKLEQWMIDLAHEKPVTESSLHKGRAKKNLDSYSYMYGDDAKDFFEKRNIRLDIAEEFKCKYHRGTLLVDTYDIHGNPSGQQIRYINRKPKYKLLPKRVSGKDVYPNYSRCLPHQPIKYFCFLVESVYDAMKLYQATSLPSIAILGTSMKMDLFMKLSVMSRQFSTTWVLYFDPDAKVISKLLATKLSGYGIRVVEICTALKPYEYSDDDLESLINEVL